MIKKFSIGLLLLAIASSVAAQAPNDVGAQISGQQTKYKVSKKGGAQVQLVTIATYFAPNVVDPRKALKASASGTLTYYISNDKKLSPDDRYLFTKKMKLKAFMPRFLKAKANLAPEDKGRYILVVVDSPQDQYAANNVDSYNIPLYAF